MSKPLAIDLYCGLGGWTDGLLAEGWDVIGFDIEQHVYGEERYPAQLVLQDVRTIHGKQFKDAAIIVASSPCQEFSWRAMPFSKARNAPPPALGMELFAQVARIQSEAIAAGDRYIPAIQENVRGAEKYVGRATAKFGPFYLWGDVPALLPLATGIKKGLGIGSISWGEGKGNRHPNDPRNYWSGSVGRKMASARAAKIPFALASHIARVYKPRLASEAA